MVLARDTTRVPSCRTEVLIVPSHTPSRELLHGQGLGGAPFHGGDKSLDFHFLLTCFLTVLLKLQSEQTRVGFVRTQVPVGANCATVRALLHGHGPVGPRVQKRRQTLDFHIEQNIFLTVFVTIVKEDGRV